MVLYDYTVTFDPGVTNTVITDFCETLKITEIGSGEIRSFALRLNADRGAFITDTNSGSTPILDEFDKIKVDSTDNNGNTFSAIYEIKTLHPTQDGLQGTVLPIDLVGPEQHLQLTHFADQFFFESAFDVAEQIITLYNTNKGSLQPTITGQTLEFGQIDSILVVDGGTGYVNGESVTITGVISGANNATGTVVETSGGIIDSVTITNPGSGYINVELVTTTGASSSNALTAAVTFSGFNNFPMFTANDYLFNIRELTHYDGLMQTQDRMGSSVAAGGAGDFFETYFATVDEDEIEFQGFSSGNRPDQITIPNIIDTNSVSPGEEEGGIEATRGTVTATWGADNIGTLPRQNQDFIGGLEAWQLFPEHLRTGIVTYPEDSIVLLLNILDTQGDNIHWKANKDTTISPPTTATDNADWDQYFFTSFLTTEVGTSDPYSLWTDGQNNAWKSNGARTDGAQNEDPPAFSTSLAVWDSNLVINDGTFTRTWVDTKALNFAGINAVFKRNSSVYRGFRVLVNGVGTDEFVGFDQDVIQWNGSQWLIFKEATTEALVAVDDEAVVYQFDTDTSNAWADISGSLGQANDCYHAVLSIFNSQGINNKDDGASGNFGDNSAVTHEFRYAKGDIVSSVFDQARYYRQFAGINLRVPFPFNSRNGNTTGALYGDNDSLDPATFDANNMTFTASGLTGFNNTESEELGPLDAFTFALKAEWRFNDDGSGSLISKGNIPFRCAMFDLDDTVVVQDFTLSFNNIWETVSLPLGNFQTYKARAPWSFGDLGQNIFLQELEILNSFRWRNIKKIAIHWLGPYDDQGRFQPWGQFDFLFPSFTDIISGFFVNDYNFKLSIDAVQFAKPLLSVSPPVTTGRSLQPRFFQEPLITNKFQLDQSNLAKLEIVQFRHKEFEITTEMRFDIPPGGSFFLENSKLISNSDRTVSDLEAWADGVEYIIGDDVQNGGNGFRCIQNNTGDDTLITGNEPGVSGNNAVDFWVALADPIPNTIKLVNKKAIHTIDKPPNGPGGALTTFTGIKRFE